jgi:hypothetical protein
VGNDPRVLITLRNDMFSDSIALVHCCPAKISS